MMKIIAIGLLYNVLLQSGAAGDPMVKVQMCSDVFDKAMTESLNQIKPSELQDNIGDLETESSKGNSRAREKGNKQSEMIPLTSVQLKVLPRSKILSNDNYETKLQVKIIYGDKKLTWDGRRWSQNSYLYLDLYIIVVVNVTVNRDRIVFELKDCDVSLRNCETNLDSSWQVATFWSKWGRNWKVKNVQRRRQQSENTYLDQVETKLGDIVDRIIDILNENWKDYLIIDPSGDAKLRLNSIIQKNVDCLELTLDLFVGNLKVISAQRHGELPRTAISLLKDYINNMVWAGDYITELGKKMEQKKLQLSPYELQQLAHDVHETDQTTLKCMPTEMLLQNETMTMIMKLEAFATKSDKSILTITFEIRVNIVFLLNEEKLRLQFTSSGDQVIHNSEIRIGKSGDIDSNYLHLLLKKISSGPILDAMNEIDKRINIPLWHLGSNIAITSEAVVILSEEK